MERLVPGAADPVRGLRWVGGPVIGAVEEELRDKIEPGNRQAVLTRAEVRGGGGNRPEWTQSSRLSRHGKDSLGGPLLLESATVV